MKKMILATIVAASILITSAVIAKASDCKPNEEIKKPRKITGPYPVTMREWTDIIKSLRKPDERPIPDKPFRFSPKRNIFTEL